MCLSRGLRFLHVRQTTIRRVELTLGKSPIYFFSQITVQINTVERKDFDSVERVITKNI